MKGLKESVKNQFPYVGSPLCFIFFQFHFGILMEFFNWTHSLWIDFKYERLHVNLHISRWSETCESICCFDPYFFPSSDPISTTGERESWTDSERGVLCKIPYKKWLKWNCFDCWNNHILFFLWCHVNFDVVGIWIRNKFSNWPKFMYLCTKFIDDGKNWNLLIIHEFTAN